MSEVAPTDSSSILTDISAKTKFQEEVGPNNELGQDEFLSLMTTQLQNQDPLAPMENGDFIAQLAQFGTVSGIGELQTSFDELTTALTGSDVSDAANLVGKSVLTEGDYAFLDQDTPLRGAVDVPQGVSNIQVRIESLGGELLHTIEIPNQSEGLASFEWDGVMKGGEVSPPGNYIIKSSATGTQGPETLSTYVGTRVDSVSIGKSGNGILLNLTGLGAKPLSEIEQLGI